MEEEILGKAYDTRLMKRLIKYLKPYRYQVTIGVIFSLMISAMEAIRPVFTKIAVDKDIANKDSSGLLQTVLIFLCIMILRGIIQYANAFLTQWIGQKTIFDIRIEIYKHLQKLSLKFYDKNPVGKLITRVTNDVETLNEMFSSGIVMVFSDIFTIFGILFFMFDMNWTLSLISISVLPFLFYGTFLFRRKAREAYREVRVCLAKINTFMQEHITGMIIDQLFNRQNKSFKTFSAINANHRDANIKSIFYYAIFYPAVDLLGAIAIGLIIWYAGVNSLNNYITIGTLMAFVQFNEMFWRPIRDLSEKYNILQTAMASSERIFQLLDDKSIIKENNKMFLPNSIKGNIEFKNVWFAYNFDDNNNNNTEWILKDVSFKIEQGKTIAIVGHTGAGKTTIINLLTRFYEIQRGEILIDGINIKDINSNELRKNISVVPQDIFLFSGDIKNNISLGNTDITQERIEYSANIVGADIFINNLTDKYNAEVKERGATLSLGQKQLITLARAIAYDPKILILDEATSSVDTETEYLIQQAIERILKNRTAIVIAHRLSTIKHADKIIVLHKGTVRESGTHKELLLLNGVYKKLYELQYKQQEINK